MNKPPRTLKFKTSGAPISIRVYSEEQRTEDNRLYNLEIDTPDGPACMTFESFIKMSQSVLAMLNPKFMLETT